MGTKCSSDLAGCHWMPHGCVTGCPMATRCTSDLADLVGWQLDGYVAHARPPASHTIPLPVVVRMSADSCSRHRVLQMEILPCSGDGVLPWIQREENFLDSTQVAILDLLLQAHAEQCKVVMAKSMTECNVWADHISQSRRVSSGTSSVQSIFHSLYIIYHIHVVNHIIHIYRAAQICRDIYVICMVWLRRASWSE
jgi:hypothetical protein